MSHTANTGSRKSARIERNAQKSFGPAAPATEPQSRIVYLRVNRRFLLQLNPPTALQPNPPPSQPNMEGNLYVIAAPINRVQWFAGNTVDWLVRISKLMFLYTFQTRSVQYWLDNEIDNSWRQVGGAGVHYL
jgi:hypothetical protein